jgi:hypothetical protein
MKFAKFHTLQKLFINLFDRNDRINVKFELVLNAYNMVETIGK